MTSGSSPKRLTTSFSNFCASSEGSISLITVLVTVPSLVRPCTA